MTGGPSAPRRARASGAKAPDRFHGIHPLGGRPRASTMGRRRLPGTGLDSRVPMDPGEVHVAEHHGDRYLNPSTEVCSEGATVGGVTGNCASCGVGSPCPSASQSVHCPAERAFGPVHSGLGLHHPICRCICMPSHNVAVRKDVTTGSARRSGPTKASPNSSFGCSTSADLWTTWRGRGPDGTPRKTFESGEGSAASPGGPMKVLDDPAPPQPLRGGIDAGTSPATRVAKNSRRRSSNLYELEVLARSGPRVGRNAAWRPSSAAPAQADGPPRR